MNSDRSLKHWYDKFNGLYFNGELPQIVIYWEPLSNADGSTCPVYEVDHGQFQIKLDPSIKGFPCLWKITLLHEMVHVKLWVKHPKHQHGKLFQTELSRIFNLGAYKKLL